MKKQLLTLTLGLTLSATGTSIYANTGTINFEGRITASTCPIEVVNPGDGTIGNLVKMGTIESSRFTAVGQEYNGKSFALRVSDPANCSLDEDGNVARVTFNGTADSTGKYFAVSPTSDGATGVSIVIKDRSGASIDPGAESTWYAIDPVTPTDMVFNAYYRSISAAVTPGAASADVQFIVAFN
ncbi:MAG TPA: fimbrial protein [Pseudomonas sp.]